MSSKTNKYTMKDYGRKSTFASFLPGIAGIKGTPIWCYYVNRGQAVVSFGVDNKDHAIMDFSPAHTAYQNVKRTGFRTFIRKNGEFFEPFSNEKYAADMHISMNGLSLEENNTESGLKTEVSYFILPEEAVGALVRKVTITNITSEKISIEALDGMPALIPFGISLWDMKNMLQTAKAWMQVEDHETGVPFYRVRASLQDTTSIQEIKPGNFATAVAADGKRLPVIVDPDTIFGYDSSLTNPVEFMENGLAGVEANEQIVSNLLPCSFFEIKADLGAGESTTVYEMIGQVASKDILEDFIGQGYDGEYFENKKARADILAEEIVSGIETKTGDPKFDEYCKYSYMDNVLRGGYPIKLGDNVFYVYSRKHGDIERDYNYFSMSPEFYSQGNGNFRDVNQNRRCDTFFAPYVGKENMHTFYSLIQLDGYNPLGIEKITYKDEDGNTFTPGQLYTDLMKKGLSEEETDKAFIEKINKSERQINANFGEGYWTDHWTYNLDLVEEYLSVFPEKEEDMLYEEAYTYYLSQVNVNNRIKRYEATEGGIRQYYSLNEASKRDTKEKLVRASYGKGDIIKSTLMEKLILLCATKFATLDPYGMGVEMEAGKPGWYDALNGLPGLLGSSMAETYELLRNIDFTVDALKKYPRNVNLLADIADLMKNLDRINAEEKDAIDNDRKLLSFWNKISDARETYRDKTFGGISGVRKEMSAEELMAILEGFRHTISCGIAKACEYGEGICPTYFRFEVPSFDKDEKGIMPTDFEVKKIPYFLEGPVRYLKLGDKAFDGKAPIDIKTLYENVKNSDVYDKELSMYKVNASLLEESFELGRARAFTPGWLENESVWMHMEYKYLLELIKAGMYEEFAMDFKASAVPFLDEEVYGRSTLENSSFIASSKNPNPKFRGKGFVARLSGSTIEIISIWKQMMFGTNPFSVHEGELTLSFEPTIPEYLVGDELQVSAKFLGHTMITYRLEEKKNYFPGNYKVAEMNFEYQDGSSVTIAGGNVAGKTAEAVRSGDIKNVVVTIK